MALAMYLELPWGEALPYATPGEAGSLINAAFSCQDKAHRPKTFYDSEREGQTQATRGFMSGTQSLDDHPYLIFAKDKDTLIRCLEANSYADFTTNTGLICVVRNNYRPSGKIVTETIANPFLALKEKAKANWTILRQAGGITRERHYDVLDPESGKTIRQRHEALDYVDWETLHRNHQRQTRVRAGYYILLTRAKDLGMFFDHNSKRVYHVMKGNIRSSGLATLLRQG